MGALECWHRGHSEKINCTRGYSPKRFYCISRLHSPPKLGSVLAATVCADTHLSGMDARPSTCKSTTARWNCIPGAKTKENPSTSTAPLLNKTVPLRVSRASWTVPGIANDTL
jgi:hypothetical protein